MSWILVAVAVLGTNVGLLEFERFDMQDACKTAAIFLNKIRLSVVSPTGEYYECRRANLPPAGGPP